MSVAVPREHRLRATIDTLRDRIDDLTGQVRDRDRRLEQLEAENRELGEALRDPDLDPYRDAR